jgi:hypothetical protein
MGEARTNLEAVSVIIHSPMPLTKRTRLRSYEIIELIEAGGMGEVYLELVEGDTFADRVRGGRIMS